MDVLGAHRQQRRAPRVPAPYATQNAARSRASSIASGGSRATTGESQTTRTNRNGIVRQIHPVTRRSRSTVYSLSGLPEPLSSNNKMTLDDAFEIYISDLSVLNAWPNRSDSTNMATEALMQANQRARNKGLSETDAESKDFLIGQVCMLSVATVLFTHKKCRSDVQVPDGGRGLNPKSMIRCTCGILPLHQRSVRLCHQQKFKNLPRPRWPMLYILRRLCTQETTSLGYVFRISSHRQCSYSIH